MKPREIKNKLTEIVNELQKDDYIDKGKLDFIHQLIIQNEYGVAFEFLVDLIDENNISIENNVYINLIEIAKSMHFDVTLYTFLKSRVKN